MGKEANLLEAARTGNPQAITTFISKAKSGSSRPKSQRKLSLFSHQYGHNHRTGNLSRKFVSSLVKLARYLFSFCLRDSVTCI